MYNIKTKTIWKENPTFFQKITTKPVYFTLAFFKKIYQLKAVADKQNFRQVHLFCPRDSQN